MIPESPFCNIKKIGQCIIREYNGGKIIDILKWAINDGMVYTLAIDQTRVATLKIKISRYNFLHELSAIEALRKEPEPNLQYHKLNSYGKLQLPIGKEITKLLGGVIIENKQNFCIEQSWISSHKFTNTFSQFNLNNYNDLKMILRYFILILRQLQLLHFSYNSHGGKPDTFFKVNSYTLSHCNLHGNNVLLAGTNLHVPVIVNMGISITHMLPNELALFPFFYNSQLEKDKRKVIQPKVIQPNMIINHCQQMDFCYLLLILLHLLFKHFKYVLIPMAYCSNFIRLRRTIFPYRKLIERLPYFQNEIFRLHFGSLVHFFIEELLRPLPTYESSWMRLSKIFI
ncbi:hypothetical protein SNEBB_003032 [Seison nebaliae]|nr:hypothetical protein SNEBB_003032 [Seison nebaliae]